MLLFGFKLIINDISVNVHTLKYSIVSTELAALLDTTANCSWYLVFSSDEICVILNLLIHCWLIYRIYFSSIVLEAIRLYNRQTFESVGTKQY
jgi:hypothetical protein